MRDGCVHRRGRGVAVGHAVPHEQRVDVRRLADADGPVAAVSSDVDAEEEGRFAHVLHLVLLGELSLDGGQLLGRVARDEQVVDVQRDDGDAAGPASDVHAAVGVQRDEALGHQ